MEIPRWFDFLSDVVCLAAWLLGLWLLEKWAVCCWSCYIAVGGGGGCIKLMSHFVSWVASWANLAFHKVVYGWMRSKAYYYGKTLFKASPTCGAHAKLSKGDDVAPSQVYIHSSRPALCKAHLSKQCGGQTLACKRFVENVEHTIHTIRLDANTRLEENMFCSCVGLALFVVPRASHFCI